MAVRLVDLEARQARLSSVLGDVSGLFQGSNVAPAGRSGILGAQLDAVNASLSGLFIASPNRTGILAPSLTDAAGSLLGSFSSPASGIQLVSRGLPVFATSGVAANAISANYNNVVASTGTPERISLDLAGLTAAQKASMALYIYNDATTQSFCTTGSLIGSFVDVPTGYTVEANTGAGGGSPPTSGWSTLASVSGSIYSQRRHAISLSGYNWVSVNISASSNTNAQLKVDLYDVSAGNRDVFFVGDSRTYFGMGHQNPGAACDSFGNLVATSAFGRVVPQINGGMSGWKVSDVAGAISRYLAAYPCKYVVINAGTNDATASGWFTQWDTDMTAIVNACKASGATTFLETIGVSPGVAANVGTYNSHIASIVSATGCQAGWDAATEWTNTQGLIDVDTIHRIPAGNVNDRTKRAAFYGAYFAAH